MWDLGMRREVRLTSNWIGSWDGLGGALANCLLNNCSVAKTYKLEQFADGFAFGEQRDGPSGVILERLLGIDPEMAIHRGE